MEKVKVLIVGAGPAGCTCGLLLLKKKVECLVIDQAEFPRDKICGGGLPPRSYRFLSQLLPEFRYDYNNVKRLKLSIEGREVIDIQMKEELRIVKRRQFDAQLLETYQKSGGAFLNDSLMDIEEKDGEVIATLKSGRQMSCDYLVGADGANSRVRKYLNPHCDRGSFILEQYGPKSPENAIQINLSASYQIGYYYSFPNAACDVQGFGDKNTTLQSFRQVLREMGCPDLKPMGAYIPQSTDYPLHERILLIGDAGGYANRLTFEGIYYAFLTASHAAEAISTGRPFAEVCRRTFVRKRTEERVARFFYSKTGLGILRFLCRTSPWLVRWCFIRLTT
jgi:flavin-dependent dehydrogenase